MIWIHTKPLWHLRPGLNYIPPSEFGVFIPLGRRKHHPPIWRLYVRFRFWNRRPQIIVDLGKLVWRPDVRWDSLGPPAGYGTETMFAVYWPDWGWREEQERQRTRCLAAHGKN